MLPDDIFNETNNRSHICCLSADCRPDGVVGGMLPPAPFGQPSAHPILRANVGARGCSMLSRAAPRSAHTRVRTERDRDARRNFLTPRDGWHFLSPVSYNSDCDRGAHDALRHASPRLHSSAGRYASLRHCPRPKCRRVVTRSGASGLRRMPRGTCDRRFSTTPRVAASRHPATL